MNDWLKSEEAAIIGAASGIAGMVSSTIELDATNEIVGIMMAVGSVAHIVHKVVQVVVKTLRNG